MRKVVAKQPPKTPPKPVEPPPVVWSCQAQGQTKDLTVGDKFTVTCTGNMDGFQVDKLEIKDKDFSPETPVLSLLESSVEGSNLKLVVTSYRTGEHKLDEIKLWDGVKKVELTGFDWSVKSILKKDPANPPQPIPAFGMVRLSYPIWFWILLVLILAVIVGGPYWQFNRFKKRKKQFEDLKNLDSALNPLDAFFKEMRKVEKKLDKDDFNADEFVKDIHKLLLVFLSRSFQLPIHLWGSMQSLREIKRKYPKVARDHGAHLQKYFSELTRIKKQLAKKDCAYLQVEGQKLVEAIDESLEKYHDGKNKGGKK